MTTRLDSATATLLHMMPPEALTIYYRELLQREMYRARSEETRLLTEATAKDERIRELEAAVSAVMDAMTTFDGGRVIVNMGRDGYAKVLAALSTLAKVSP